MKKLILIITINICLSQVFIEGQDYLRFGGEGAQSIALGKALITKTNTPLVSYSNPAALSFIETNNFMLDWGQVLPNAAQDYFKTLISFNYKINTDNMIGGYIYHFNMDEYFLGLDGYGDTYEFSNGCCFYYPDTVISSINKYKMAISLSYPKKINDNSSLGVSIKVLSENYMDKIGSEKTSYGYAFDLGYLLVLKHFKIGASIKNIGNAFDKEKNELPLQLLLGSLYEVNIYNRRFDFLLDIDRDLNNADIVDYSLGLEYIHSDNIIIRSGYLITELGYSNYERFYTWGLGYKFKNIIIDFGYRGGEQGHPLSNTMLFSLTYQMKNKSITNPL